MVCCRTAGVLLALCLSSAVATAQSSVPAGTTTEATLFRVFLKDGTSLVSYGEVARVGDRVVFSMPTTTASAADPDLHLINLPADRVDWDHTTKYADAARANRYLATQAEADYAQLSNEVAAALNAVAATPDPATRLSIVQKARNTLSEWPARHFNYKQNDIKQMLTMLDEAAADLRVDAGSSRFDLTFVAVPNVPIPDEPLLPQPTAQEAIEGVLTAARVTDSAVERSTLLNAALGGIAKNADALPPDWAAATAAATAANIAREQATDRTYRSFTSTMMSLAKSRARMADVRGLQRLLEQIHARDAALGGKRPDTVNSLIDSVQAELDAARRLQLVRDQWAMRAPDYRKYRASILASLNSFALVKESLENIKALAGSSPYALATIERTNAEIRKNIAAATPPEELAVAHSLLQSAVELSDQAAKIRREAALTASMTRAWDASAAAAGSLMLVARARDEISAALKMPQLAQLPPQAEAQLPPPQAETAK
jgi:hypothetical protein